jgi:isoleucyl-tRNA synthetase
VQGLLPAIAPMLPHLAEDAWEHLPYERPTASIFQSGWAPAPEEWRGADDVAPTFKGLLAIRWGPHGILLLISA